MNYLNCNKLNTIYFHEVTSAFALMARNICSQYGMSDAVFPRIEIYSTRFRMSFFRPHSLFKLIKICEIRLTTLIFMGNSLCLSCSCRWLLQKECPHWLCGTAYHLYFMLSGHSLQLKFCPRYVIFANVLPHSIYPMFHL